MLTTNSAVAQAHRFWNILISPGLQRGVRSTPIVTPILKQQLQFENFNNVENNYQRQLGE